MVLGDNIFCGYNLSETLASANRVDVGGVVFGYHVSDPERYGVMKFDAEGRVQSMVEKPDIPPSNYAVTGLYSL